MDIYYTYDLPETAAGFLGGISGGDIEEIIGGLDDYDIEGNDNDLLNNDRTNTPDLENKRHTNKNSTNESNLDTESNLVPETEQQESIIVEYAEDKQPTSDIIVDENLMADRDSDHEESSDSDNDFIVVAKDNVKGGGNVLQILISLIPSVFPKSYM